MVYIWATSLVVINAVWLALVLVGLPGNWLMVATTALVAWWQWGPPPATTAPAGRARHVQLGHADCHYRAGDRR